jgi:hypothetical protein
MRALLALTALSLLGYEAPSSTPRNSRTLIRVPVVDQAEPPIERNAFSARLDGSPAKVLSVKGPEDDLILLLVLDLSGDPVLIDTARQALAEQLTTLGKNHWVGLLRAQDRLQALSDPTPNRDKVIDTIRAYNAVGKAGLLDTIENVAALGQRLMQRSGVRVAVLYVTDSNISNYREDYTNPVINSSDSRDLSRKFPDQLIKEKMQKLSDQLSRFEAPIYLAQISYFGDPINEAYQRGLLQLATESGGLGMFCRSRGEIPNAIEQVVRAASRHWSVAVELKNARQRAVTVDISNKDRSVPNRARFALGKQ